MKFLGSLFAFAIIGICSVFAAPAYDTQDAAFYYKLDRNNKKAAVVGIRVTNVNINTLPLYATVSYNGQTYDVNEIGAYAFSDTHIQYIKVNKNKSMNFAKDAFNGCKNLRGIELNINNVTADKDAFNGAKTTVSFTGVGTESLIKDYALKLARKLSLPITDYNNPNLSESYRMKGLHRLTYEVKNNFVLNDKVADSNNVATVLAFQQGSRLGIARAYRMLALSMGFAYNDVHVGTDKTNLNWNYVYVNKDGKGRKWYSVNAIESDIIGSYTTNFVVKRDDFKINGRKPSEYYIYNNQYGYNGEKQYNPTIEKFYDWLVRNRAGVIA